MLQLLLVLFVLTLPQAAAKPAVQCANIWQNRNAEIEEYLRLSLIHI